MKHMGSRPAWWPRSTGCCRRGIDTQDGLSGKLYFKQNWGYPDLEFSKRRTTMGFGVVALVLTAAICAYGVHMSNLGRKADRARRHPRVPR
ncbi:Putative N-acetylglucosaminyl transferase (modular protein) [Paraburkholderia piptadeniae]|uniref:N-acetylglucosaminyl transferase (Modular protein) n=1 Tax=Paraburkholderia piptadeniae TaxID=1701573 RepID=A0A1N7SS61_9BURK|nr:Putative N-acetylglucosaminyl transferase (modular protein) [Paraburkholderia piptadeniae]